MFLLVSFQPDMANSFFHVYQGNPVYWPYSTFSKSFFFFFPWSVKILPPLITSDLIYLLALFFNNNILKRYYSSSYFLFVISDVYFLWPQLHAIFVLKPLNSSPYPGQTGDHGTFWTSLEWRYKTSTTIRNLCAPCRFSGHRTLFWRRGWNSGNSLLKLFV